MIFFGTAAAEDDHRINPLYLGEPGGILCAETAVAPGPRQRAGHNTTVNTNLRIRFYPYPLYYFVMLKSFTPNTSVETSPIQPH